MKVQRVTEREPPSMKQTDIKGSCIVRASFKTLDVRRKSCKNEVDQIKNEGARVFT